MATTSTELSTLILNLLTQEQYNNATKNANELYLISNIDNSEIFIATYDTTTAEEIITASNNNKICLCKKTIESGSSSTELVGYLKAIGDSQTCIFEAFDSDNILGKFLFFVDSNNSWSQLRFDVTTEISNTSTNEQYVTAKAVYDFLETAMGTILNGAS